MTDEAHEATDLADAIECGAPYDEGQIVDLLRTIPDLEASCADSARIVDLEEQNHGLHLRLERLQAELTALRAQVGRVPKAPSGDEVLTQVFALCEATEDESDREIKNLRQEGFERGRKFEAKQIRRGIGNWYQDAVQAMLSSTPTAPQAGTTSEGGGS